MSQENVAVVRRYFEGTGGPLEGESRWSDVKDYYPGVGRGSRTAEALA